MAALKKNIIIVPALMWLIFAITFNLELIRSNHELGDFGSFIAAGANTRDGLNPYDTSSPLIFETSFPKFGVGGKQPNLNPPISLLVFQHLADADSKSALEVWRLASFTIFLIAYALLIREYKPRPIQLLWGVALAGLWHTIGLGQVYTILLLLATLAWISYRDGKSMATGIFLGLLISIKPNFALWILILALRREWKLVVTATIVIVVCALLPLTQLPPQVYVQWLEASRVESSVLSMPGNSSLIGLTSRMDLPALGIAIGVILLVFAAFAVHRLRDGQPDRDTVSAAGIFLSLLISPITWTGYTILALPYFLSQKQWTAATTIAAAILSVPFNFTMYFYYYFGRFNFIFWGWWYGIALTICTSVTIAQLFKYRREMSSNSIDALHLR